MIRVICGGKKNSGAYLEIIGEYTKRLKKPFEIQFEFFEEEKLAKLLEKWEFKGSEFVILADERGKILSSPEFAELLEKNFNNSKEVVLVIGGAYGFSDEAREKADFLWSFSKLVFPHLLARVIATEQIYRAQEISHGGKYHHE